MTDDYEEEDNGWAILPMDVLLDKTASAVDKVVYMTLISGAGHSAGWMAEKIGMDPEELLRSLERWRDRGEAYLRPNGTWSLRPISVTVEE